MRLTNPSSTLVRRSNFLSSSAAAFLGAITVVMSDDPETCEAQAADLFNVGRKNFKHNPRYIEKELQMQYGEDPGAFLLV